MSTVLSLEQLIEAVRQRADMVNSTFVTDLEVTSYINQSWFELYDLLVQKYGNNYYVAPYYEFVTNGTDQQYPLPEDFFKLLGVDLAVNGQDPDAFYTLKRFEFADRNKYSLPNNANYYGITNVRYQINGSKIWFIPTPVGAQTVRLWYVPRAVPLVNLTDTLDGVNGWTEYVICDAAMKCLQKEESDVSVLMAEKVALIQRINNAAENRDAGMPATVSDSQNAGFGFPGWPYGGFQ